MIPKSPFTDQPVVKACAICGFGIARYCITPIKVDYKGTSYLINRHYYHCDTCHEQYTNDVLDQLTLEQIPGSIWEQLVLKDHQSEV